MHNKHAPILICLRTTIQIIQELNGSFLIPNILIKKYVASCTTSVYVNLSKNSFFTLNAQKLGESGCKGTNNFNTNQTFSIKNSQKYKDFQEY